MRILLIEDDEKLCDSLKLQLERENMTVDVCHNGEDGLFLIRDQAHDLILLDRMIPFLDGIEVLRQMRLMQILTPVIMLTALGELEDKVEGLDCGADDYIVKPFAFEELTARIRSIGRRPRRWEANDSFRYGDISYKPNERKLTKTDTSCSLSKREGDLLEFFLRNPNQILPRPTIITKVWGPDSEVEEGNLDNYIHLLRRRLRAIGSTLTLKTVRGVGYCLEEPHV